MTRYQLSTDKKLFEEEVDLIYVYGIDLLDGQVRVKSILHISTDKESVE